MKKIFVIFIVILLLVSWYLFFVQRKKSSLPFVVVPTPAIAALAPSGVFVPGEPKNVTFQVAATLPPLPTELPLYRPAYSSVGGQNVSRFAASLGLPAPTSSINRSGITNNYWNTPDFSISYAEDKTKRTLSFQRITPPEPPNSTNPSEAIASFISSLGVSKKIDLRLAKTNRPTSIEGATFPDVPRLTIYYYQFTISDIPLLLSNYDSISLSVGVDARGAIRTSSVTFPPDELQLVESKPTLTLENALVSLNQKRGLLISVEEDANDEYAPAPEFTSVLIYGVTLGYVHNTARDLLVPVYIFKGTGASQNKKQTVEYLLMATGE